MRDRRAQILRKVELDRFGCWLWTGWVDSWGYGSTRIARRKTGAHRVSYEAFVGPIPEGLTIDHLCRVRRCVNPDHLEPVTLRENILRSFAIINAAASRTSKTECGRGHPFTPENTYVDPTRGWRKCRTCSRAADARKRNKRRAAA